MTELEEAAKEFTMQKVEHIHGSISHPQWSTHPVPVIKVGRINNELDIVVRLDKFSGEPEFSICNLGLTFTADN